MNFKVEKEKMAFMERKKNSEKLSLKTLLFFTYENFIFKFNFKLI